MKPKSKLCKLDYLLHLFFYSLHIHYCSARAYYGNGYRWKCSASFRSNRYNKRDVLWRSNRFWRRLSTSSKYSEIFCLLAILA